jgi:hybrid cluster-associated redox disulfide protein
MPAQITADMIIHDVVAQYPDTVKVFQGHGLPCTACAVGSRESVAGGARTHSLQVEPLLADLNRAANGEPVVGLKPERKMPTGKGIPLQMAGQSGNKIRNVIAVMSGKGGVGKSLTTGLLAVALQRQGMKVGILDGDITGPSIGRMFGVTDVPVKEEDDTVTLPQSGSGIKIISMNMFLPNATDPVIWRGPMISQAIKQFWGDFDWGRLDYLLIDLPPGTSDAPMTVMQSLPLDGVVIVSSPQLLATDIVKKCIKMVQTLKGKIVGVVENMAYLPQADGSRMEVFGASNGPELVALTGSPLLAQIPIDPMIAQFCDLGRIEDYQSEEFTLLGNNFIKAVKIAR